MFGASSEGSPASSTSHIEEEQTSLQSDDGDPSSSDSDSLMSEEPSESLDVAYQLQGGIENVLNEVIETLGSHNLPEDAHHVLGSWLHAESTNLVYLWQKDEDLKIFGEESFSFLQALDIITKSFFFSIMKPKW